jgi:hypothetical protein
VGDRGMRSKGARACGGGRRTHGRGCVHGEGRGREVRDGLTGGVRGTEREQARVREKQRRQVGPIEQREGEREREEEKRCAGWRRQVGPACQGPKARKHTRAGLGLVGRLGRIDFSIFKRISNCFSIYFL